jgi:hypothetical protein
VVVHSVFYASCTTDLRWRDATIVQARGPLITDIGGSFNNGAIDVIPSQPTSWIAEFTVTKPFHTLANAEAWASQVQNDVEVAMEALRVLYAEYPTDYGDRTRTI